MRKINLEDTFKLARLLKDSNIMQIIKDAYMNGKKEANRIQSIKEKFLTGIDVSKDAENLEVAAEEEAKKEADKAQEEMGVNVILDIICSCSDKKTEYQVYDLLAGITEKTADIIKTQPLEETISDIKEICRENNITNFLKSASRLSESIKG